MPKQPDTQAKPTPATPPKQEKSLKSQETDAKKWDLIDENAWESFPASDPPASWAGRDIPPDERQEASESEDTQDAKTRAKEKPTTKN